MQGRKILAPAVFLLGVLLCLEDGRSLALDATPVPQQKLLRGHWSEKKGIMQQNHQALLKDRMSAAYPLTPLQLPVTMEQCVTCHIVRGADKTPLSAEHDKHFCRECHTKEWVSIDCFTCHASLPASDPAVMSKEVKNADMITKKLKQWQAAQGGKP